MLPLPSGFIPKEYVFPLVFILSTFTFNIYYIFKFYWYIFYIFFRLIRNLINEDPTCSVKQKTFLSIFLKYVLCVPIQNIYIYIYIYIYDIYIFVSIFDKEFIHSYLWKDKISILLIWLIWFDLIWFDLIWFNLI